MLRSILITSLVGLMMVFACVVYAAEKSQPIQIKSENAEYIGEKKIFRYTGNVEVTKKGLKMTSNIMDVFFTEDQDIREIFSKGDVRIEKEGMLALSEEARFFQNEQKVILTKNVRVWQDGNLIEGEKVTAFLDSNNILIERGKNKDKRVRVIITPKEETE